MEVEENTATQEPVENTEATTEATNVEGSEGNVSTQEQTAQEVWDGKQFALKLRGREIIPESKEKLINLAQLGHVYSSKLNDIQSREEAIAERQKAVEQYENIAKAFDSNPSFKQQILALYHQSQIQPNEQSQEADLPPQYAQKINEVQQRLETYEKQRADEDLRNEIQELISSNQGYDWHTPDEHGQTMIHDVLKRAKELGGVPLATAFRDVAWEQAQEIAKAEALKANQIAKESQAKKGKPVSPQQGVNPAPQKAPKDYRSMNYNEIAREALSELKS